MKTKIKLFSLRLQLVAAGIRRKTENDDNKDTDQKYQHTRGSLRGSLFSQFYSLNISWTGDSLAETREETVPGPGDLHLPTTDPM